MKVVYKEPPRCMYPGEFVGLLQKHIAGSWYTCGVESNRWGDRSRADAGITPSGTVWFATVADKVDEFGGVESGREMPIIVPRDCLPYKDIVKGKFREAQHRFQGETARGWRSAFRDLIKRGHLRPSKEMTWLIGEDSFGLYPH